MNPDHEENEEDDYARMDNAWRENQRDTDRKPMNTQTDQSLAVVRPQEPLLAVIERASRDPSIDVAKMEKLLELAERVHARQAEAEYDGAMNSAQGEMRPIATDSDNPQTRSRYASYGALDRAVRPIYSAHGFSLSFGTRLVAVDRVTITCRVSHRAGHTERVEIDMPADGKGAKGGDVMTKTHATGSAVSYGMRYLLKMIFNLAIGEYDDDGNSAGKRSTASSPRQATSTPPAPKNAVATHSKPNGEQREATEATRTWMLKELSSYGEVLLHEYAVKSGTLLETEDLSDWPFSKVPTSKDTLRALMKSIEEFRDGGAPPPFMDPPAGQILPKEIADVIVPIPRKGQTRNDYLRTPDTIGSLFAARHGTDDEAQEARQRLWGFVSHYEPKGWTKKDGTQMSPSSIDIQFREKLDAFADWFEKHHPDEKL